MDGRAKPLMDRKVIDVSSLSLSLSLSVSFSDYLPTYPPIYLSTYLSIYQCNHPCNDQLFNHPALLRIEKWFKNGTSLLNHPVKDGGAATTKITPMPLPVRKCIATANGDRKQPTAKQTILSFCSTKKQSPQKSDARSYEVLHLSRKMTSANLKIWCSKFSPSQDLLTALMNMSLVLRLPRKMHLCRSSSNVPRLPSFLEMPQNPHGLLTFDKVHNPLRLPRETTSQRPKVVRTPCVFNILTSKCASRHNGVHFLDISICKSAPVTRCFVHFDFEMCFAPQRRAIFYRSSGQMAPHPPL